jgi:hypothetical protein
MTSPNPVVSFAYIPGLAPLLLIYSTAQFSSSQSTPVQGFLNTENSKSNPQLKINARAAELKAKLKKSMQQRSGTPPVLTAKTGNMTTPTDFNTASTLVEAPKAVSNATEDHEQDLNALISEFSIPQPIPKSNLSEGSTFTEKPDFSSTPKVLSPTSSFPVARACSLGSPTMVSRPAKNGISSKTTGTDVGLNGNGHKPRKASISEISEGEILEDAPPEKAPPTEPKKALPAQNNPRREVVSSQDRTGQKPTPMQRRDSRQEGSSSRRGDSPNQSRSQRPDERRDEAPRQERKYHNEQSERRDHNESERDSYPRREKPAPDLDRRNGQGPNPESEKESYRSRQQSRDEQHQKPELPVVSRREEPNPQAATPGEVDLHGPDVRDWLVYTGFHDVEYRTKVLGRRRALAALDEQRKLLVDQIVADERGGVTQAPVQAPQSMMPPPAQTKVDPATSTAPVPSGNAQPSNKRPHSDMGDSPNVMSVKVARTNETRHKEDLGSIPIRPRSSNNSRRSSFDRPDIKDRGTRYDDDHRVRSRGNSREREKSPRPRPYEGRSRNYFDYDDPREQDEQDAPRGYQGGYDPEYSSYRGRGRGGRPYRGGRGRGRGDFYDKSSKPFRGGRGGP